YKGASVRITRGSGAGQERVVKSNTVTTLTLTSAWNTQPDPTSFFALAESSWHFGALGGASPVQFDIPNRTGETVQIRGLAANANDKESPAEVATVTRWLSGGAGGGVDGDVPPTPSFGMGLIPHRGGYLEIGGIRVSTFTNTQTIFAATLTMYSIGELVGQPQTKLSVDIEESDEAIHLAVLATWEPG